MRVAIFSDVHGNLSALQAVLKHIDSQPAIDQVVFAGDACLFGPRPAACIKSLVDSGSHCLVGNTDIWIRNPPQVDEKLEEPARQRQAHVRDLSRWTLDKLDGEAIAWLESLETSTQLRLSPTTSADNDLLVVHANPKDLNQIIFPGQERQMELYERIRQTDDELEPLFSGVRAGVVAFGHLHIPGIRRFREITLANISSVSMPGDGDSRAKYAVISWHDAEGWDIEYFFVSFAIDEEIRAFREQQPPGLERAVRYMERFGHVPQKV